MPSIPFHPVAFVVAVLAACLVNYIWYSVLFAGQWRSLVTSWRPGFDPDQVDERVALAITVAGALAMMFVLSQVMGAWTPASWGVSEGPGQVEIILSAAVFTWVGFILPTLLHQVAWEKRPWGLFAINAGGVLVTLLVGALSLALIPV